MSSGTRKGFKYKTKGAGKAANSKAVVEDIDFDEVEKETTASPQKKAGRGGKGVAANSSSSSSSRNNGSLAKRGRKAIADTDSEVELSPSPKRPKNSGKTKTTVDRSPAKNAKPKAYYPPNSSLDISRLVSKIKKGKDKDSSHKVKLGLLLKEICNSELDR